VMMLISVQASLLALGLELGVWTYLRRRNLVVTWGDAWAGIWGSLARFSIYKLTQQKWTARSWRPNILLFANQVEKRAGQVRMSAWFNQSHGILTVCNVVSRETEEETSTEEVGKREEQMNRFFEEEGIMAFGEVDVVATFEEGVSAIVQANGMGGLRANTVAFGWPVREERLVSLLRIIRQLSEVGKAALIIQPSPPGGPERFERIDVWWRGKLNNGDLMLLLAHLLKLNAHWREAQIYIRTIVTKEMMRVEIDEGLEELIQTVRIEAEQDVIVLPANKTVAEVMHEVSREADVVFMGLMTPEKGKEEEYAERLREMVAGMPTTVMVRNSGPFKGRLL